MIYAAAEFDVEKPVDHGEKFETVDDVFKAITDLSFRTCYELFLKSDKQLSVNSTARVQGIFAELFDKRSLNQVFTKFTAEVFYNILKIIRSHHESITVREYVAFLTVFLSNFHWICEGHKMVRVFLISVHQNFGNNPERVISFVNFINEIVFDYDMHAELPDFMEWADEIRKDDCFQIPASLAIPMMISDEDKEKVDEKDFYVNRYNSKSRFHEMRHFRETMASI